MQAILLQSTKRKEWCCILTTDVMNIQHLLSQFKTEVTTEAHLLTVALFLLIKALKATELYFHIAGK